MSYLNSNARTIGVTANDKFQPLGRTTMITGVFSGWVKRADDVQTMGRLQVWIPEFGSAPEEDNGWITVSYCSPFAGSTNVETINKGNVSSFDGTQTSYGMWMVPPDVGNQVIVMFIGGDLARGIWIGCLYDQFMNNMIPGMAADTNNYQYNGKYIPVAEYNKWDTKITNPNNAKKPYEATKFKGLGNQGLINDSIRGVTSSSARRDSPSTVFGIITPGPVLDSTAAPANIRRKGGSSFIMDDLSGSEYVKLATKSGAQIMLNETSGEIYLINRDGTAWVQLDKSGNIDIFGATNISMRAQRDINFRADRNINIEAGQNIYLKAAKDTTQSTTNFTYDVNNVPQPSTIPYWKYVGEGSGQGGNIVMQALNNAHVTTRSDMLISVDGNYNLTVKGNIAEQSAICGMTASEINISGPTKITGTLSVTDTITGNASGNFVGQVNAAIGNFASILAGTGSIGGASISPAGVSANSIMATTGSFAGVLSVTNIQAASSGNAPVIIPPTPGAPPGPATIPASVQAPPTPTAAEVKPMLEKMNILATWSDTESKFKRNAESVQTTVTRLPTYESSPEHDSFSFKSVTGYTPIETEGDKTYDGSGGSGNSASSSPVKNTTPGANNTDILQESPIDSVVTKDFNMAAYQCQLKIHEGVKYVSYLDSVGLPTGGIGHLLRANEIPQYPVPTPITDAQVTTWFNQDAPTSIKGAQELLTIDIWAELSDVRKRACSDLCYNMGKGRLSKFTRFLTGMKTGDWGLAGQSLQDSKWYTQVGRRGTNIITMIVQNVDPNGCDRKFPPQ